MKPSAASPPTALATTSYGGAVDGVQEGTDLPKANRFLLVLPSRKTKNRALRLLNVTS